MPDIVPINFRIVIEGDNVSQFPVFFIGPTYFAMFAVVTLLVSFQTFESCSIGFQLIANIFPVHIAISTLDQNLTENR